MNPKTKATSEQIQAICAKYGIQYRSHVRITTGFSHELHKINDNLVIKIFNTADLSDPSHFKTESALLASDMKFPKPKLVFNDGDRDILDRDFLIMSYVHGASLGSKWHEAPDHQREELIKTISQSLRSINRINASDLGLIKKKTWQEIVKERVEADTNELKQKNIIDDSTTKKIYRTLNTHLPALADAQLYPVYWDIHFDNFLVDDVFNFKAVIDLENVELTPLDYPLFVIQKMINEPEKYLSEEHEKYADKKDYKKLKGWYQQYYPEMFAFDDLENRVGLYQLLDTLHLLKDWPQVKGLYIKLDELTA